MRLLSLVLSACAAGVLARNRPIGPTSWTKEERSGNERAVERRADSALPVDKVYGVNIGHWLVAEPWMAPTEWTNMGGQFCNDDCSTCRQSEWSLATFLGQNKTNQVFKQHWESWLTQQDVDDIASVGLNTVRVPMGFWILEGIVNRTVEPYAQGGMDELIRGLNMFNDKNLWTVLGFHALPGVSTSKQMFAGNCTAEVQFFSSPDNYNFKRAVTWGIAMAYLAHTHPSFSKVWTIEALNEPTQDPRLTPGIGNYYQAFVLGIRALERVLGINCADTSDAIVNLSDAIARPALVDAAPILTNLSATYKIGPGANFNWTAALPPSGALACGRVLNVTGGNARPLSTQFMNKAWQQNRGVNPADFAHGPQVYDNHLYLNFGYIAPNATEEGYMETICNANTIKAAEDAKDTPLITGEWSLATQFNASTDFLKRYSDAQKLAWTQGSGWIFWNFKMAQDVQSIPIVGQYKQWGYKDAVDAGYMTSDPSQFFDANVCAGKLQAAQTSKGLSSGARAAAIAVPIIVVAALIALLFALPFTRRRILGLVRRPAPKRTESPAETEKPLLGRRIKMPWQRASV